MDNHWYFTDILTDVEDNPKFLDLIVTPPGGTPVNVTKNGFRHFLSTYANGTGQTSAVSGVIGGAFQLTDRLRADGGVRVEYNNYVQSSENTSTVDLDGDSTTTYDQEIYGNGSFRHFTRGITDWAASVGLNFTLTPTMALYGSVSRGYKMPSLDEFLQATAQQQVDLFDSRTVEQAELGVKYAKDRLGFTVNGFFTNLKNIVSQGAVTDTTTGRTTWVIVPSPDNRSYGAEIELFYTPLQGLQLQAGGTFLKAELGTGAGADIGSRLNGVPHSIGNVAASYQFQYARLTADWHWVADRPVNPSVGFSLPTYNYFNFGAIVPIRGTGAAINLNLLNAFMSHGLEESNPRLLTGGVAPIFLARPLLPRRFTAGIRYDF
jgi:outer membrane receptor protein involved in Fe transport